MKNYFTKITEAEAILLENYKSIFAGITSSDPIDQIYDVVKQIIPRVRGAMYEQMFSSDPYSITDTIFDLPQEFIENMMLNLEKDPTIGLVLQLPEAKIISDAEVMSERELSELKEFYDYPKHDLEQIFGIKSRVKETPQDTFHETFLFITEKNERGITEKEKTFLNILHPEMINAINRLRLPIISDQDVLHQIIRENNTGYLCLRQNGSVLEANRQAYNLITGFYPYLAKRPCRVSIREFSEGIMQGWATNFPRSVYIFDSGGGQYLEINRHFLSSLSHNLPEDIILVTLNECLLENNNLLLGNGDWLSILTNREKEIVSLLTSTGLSYKEMAFTLKISFGTMRKHAENIYRKLSVNSRAELTTLINSSHNN